MVPKHTLQRVQSFWISFKHGTQMWSSQYWTYREGPKDSLSTIPPPMEHLQAKSDWCCTDCDSTQTKLKNLWRYNSIRPRDTTEGSVIVSCYLSENISTYLLKKWYQILHPNKVSKWHREQPCELSEQGQLQSRPGGNLYEFGVSWGLTSKLPE